ncbi:MAG: phenylacetate--CoA ligase family protein [Halodesulfovibrio sp.]
MTDPITILSRYVYTPLVAIRRKRVPTAWLKFLNNLAHKTPEEVRDIQLFRLGEQLRYFHAKNPFYRAIMEKAGIDATAPIGWEEFRRLPVLTKTALQADKEKMKTQDPSLQVVAENMTGGSTGRPLAFWQDSEYWAAAGAADSFVRSWWGVPPVCRTHGLWGSDRDLGERNWKERIAASLCRIRTVDSFRMSNERIEAFIADVVAWKPEYIMGYASSLHLIAKYLLERDMRLEGPVAIRSTAETLFPEQRADIEKAFSSKVYNFYGSRECNNIAAECTAQNGLHVLAGTRIVEIVNERNEVVEHGTVGKIVVTDLVNRAFPFIRYEIGDLGAMTSEPCSCGLPFDRLSQVTGRVSDVLVSARGDLVHGEYVTHLFYGMKGVKSFQVVQENYNELILNVEKDESCTGELNLDHAIEGIRKAMGDIAVHVKFLEGTERGSSGKHRFIISKVSPFASGSNN